MINPTAAACSLLYVVASSQVNAIGGTFMNDAIKIKVDDINNHHMTTTHTHRRLQTCQEISKANDCNKNGCQWNGGGNCSDPTTPPPTATSTEPPTIATPPPTQLPTAGPTNLPTTGPTNQVSFSCFVLLFMLCALFLAHTLTFSLTLDIIMCSQHHLPRPIQQLPAWDIALITTQ